MPKKQWMMVSHGRPGWNSRFLDSAQVSHGHCGQLRSETSEWQKNLTISIFVFFYSAFQIIHPFFFFNVGGVLNNCWDWINKQERLKKKNTIWSEISGLVLCHCLTDGCMSQEDYHTEGPKSHVSINQMVLMKLSGSLAQQLVSFVVL